MMDFEIDSNINRLRVWIEGEITAGCRLNVDFDPEDSCRFQTENYILICSQTDVRGVYRIIKLVYTPGFALNHCKRMQ